MNFVIGVTENGWGLIINLFPKYLKHEQVYCCWIIV